jgi:hypothetical protein
LLGSEPGDVNHSWGKLYAHNTYVLRIAGGASACADGDLKDISASVGANATSAVTGKQRLGEADALIVSASILVVDALNTGFVSLSEPVIDVVLLAVSLVLLVLTSPRSVYINLAVYRSSEIP